MIALYAALVPGSFLACEIAFRLPLGQILSTFRDVSRKAARVLKSKRISDDWKEKVLPRYSRQLMGASLGLLCCMLAIVVPVLALAALATGGILAGSAALLAPAALAEMIVLSVIYVVLRRRLTARRG